jgi:hypothetical protein
MNKADLKLDWCSHEAAKYAVEKWHYSGRVPKSKLAKVGVWESGKFVGCVIFGVGATPEIAKPFGLVATQVVELVRVALSNHRAAVSRIIAIALKIVHKANPGLRVVVSFADSSQGHHGGIYPYPKRERSADSGTPGNQPGGGGATPTRSLQTPGGEG